MEINSFGIPVDSQFANNLTANTIEELSLILDKFQIARPTRKSPAIGTASSLWDDLQNDIDGIPCGERPFDIGCDEHSNTTSSPLNRDDVGPSWRVKR